VISLITPLYPPGRRSFTQFGGCADGYPVRVDELTDPAFEPSDRDGSRDYADVGEAARELGGRAPLPGGDERIQPIEESEEVAAAVDDEAPVPQLAETESRQGQARQGQDEDPSSSRSTRSG
jgi:hypothetical protein